MNIARPAQAAPRHGKNVLSLISRLLRAPQRETLDPLYRAIVSAGRDPAWYRAGVPDTIDGRFDMIAMLTGLVLLRLEREQAGKEASVLLTEMFVADMDSSLREIGIGDYVVGKHVGRMMGALGGRLAALREAEDSEALSGVVERNVFRGAPPSAEALALVTARLGAFRASLAETPLDLLIAGTLSTP
jgi:cytochrome b pre-mRNA-processing protein 3